MNKEERIASFQKELDCIKTESIKNAAIKMIAKLIPDYFWNVAAASTGKYHPKYAQGEGGLYRHTLAATRIAIGMFPLTNYTDIEKDMIIVALIMHDSFKHGDTYTKYTKAEHPVIAANNVKFFYSAYLEDEYEIGKNIAGLIITHMGQWNKDYRTGKELMPKPQTSMQRFVHMCDYLASRKYLEFNFEEVVNRD